MATPLMFNSWARCFMARRALSATASKLTAVAGAGTVGLSWAVELGAFISSKATACKVSKPLRQSVFGIMEFSFALVKFLRVEAIRNAGFPGQCHAQFSFRTRTMDVAGAGALLGWRDLQGCRAYGAGVGDLHNRSSARTRFEPACVAFCCFFSPDIV